MGSKDKKRHKDKAKKDKKDRHDKKTKREKKHKHSRRRDSDSGSSSDSDGAVNVNTQLAMSRAAARATREILAYKYDLKNELRELVRQLDTGGALDISGIPDEFLRPKLHTLFDNLLQLKKNSAGQYFKRQGAASVLSFIAPLLEESPASLAAYAPKPAAAAAVQAPSPAVAGPQQNGAHPAAAAGEETRGVGAESELSASPVRRTAGPIGPQAGPPAAAAEAGPPGEPQQGREEEGLVDSSGEEEEDGGSEGAGAAARRTLGPSMPTQQQLEAAAQMEYPEVEEEDEGLDLDDLLVGPPPPDLAEELDAASMDERSAQVVRISKVLAQHAAGLADATAAQAAEQPPDPYEVLGLEEGAAPAAVKKCYWRLSLLIHPDKCDHPQAHDAFQAVSRAAKELQDAGLRAAADERRQEKRLRAEFEAEAAAAERQRQWRIARGEATAADLAGPVAAQFGGPSRDSWMTELPPERKAGSAMPSMTSQIGFSKAGIKERGDTSGWTMTPQQRQAQLEGGAAAQKGPMLLTAGGEGGAAAQQRLHRTAAAIDQYNSQLRKKSLLEQHLDKQKEPAAKKRKKDKGAAAAAAQPAQDWDPTQHPWRPFDREKDLGPGLGKGPAAAQDLLKNAKALGSRFSGGQGSTQRSFL